MLFPSMRKSSIFPFVDGDGKERPIQAENGGNKRWGVFISTSFLHMLLFRAPD